ALRDLGDAATDGHDLGRDRVHEPDLDGHTGGDGLRRASEDAEDLPSPTGRLHAELGHATEDHQLGAFDPADGSRRVRVHSPRTREVLLRQDLVDLRSLGDAELLALVSLGDEDVGDAGPKLAVELLPFTGEVYRADPHASRAHGETGHGDDVALVPGHRVQVELPQVRSGVLDLDR